MADSTGTADALIRAGRTLFAQYGYDGAAVRAITTAAGANLGAITYHFGSKRELYDRVVESVVTPLAAGVEAVVDGDGDVLDRVAAVVQVYFEYLSENPDLPQLMMQELALGGVPAAVVAAPMMRVHGALMKLVREGQAAGVVRPGPAEFLGVFILSVPVHMGLLRTALQAYLGVDLQDRAVRRRVMEAAQTFVCSGLSGAEAQ